MINVLSDLWGKAKSGVKAADDKYNKMSLSQQLAAGGDMVSALQRFGAFQLQARGLKAQANSERGAAAMELGNYNSNMSEAQDRYLRAVAETEVAAAGSGIDVSSGSVKARKASFASEFADFNRIASENAIAALHARNARMLRFKSDAARTKTLAWTNLFGDILKSASAIMDAGGGPK